MTQDSLQLQLNSAAVSDRGLSEKRPQNEDSYLEQSARGLFAVADGVGGAQAGDVASQMAVEILGEAFANLSVGGDVEELMKVAIQRANGAIFQMSHDLAQLSTMATTVVALQLTGNIATIGHVGDSRLYRMDSRGQLFRETQDHSVVEEEVRAGRMTAAQAAHHPSRNVISRALGAEIEVEVDMKTMMIEPNTTFLLCSDGITRHIEDHEIRDLLLSMPNPAEICARMKEICYSRGAEDNLTAVIVKVGAANNGMPLDIEENTVTTARSAAASGAVLTADTDEDLEIPTQNLQGQIPNFDKTEPILIPEAQSSTAANYQAQTEAVRDEKTFTIDEEKGGSFISKFLTAWLLLILGGIVGAALYYFLSPKPAQPVAEPPKITQMQTPNIEYSAFENLRRKVDQNPEQFISAGGSNAQSAEDYYLLGRAYLLTGKYTDASAALIKAKELLSQSSGDTAMLKNEINFGLSIVDSQYSRRFLDNERSLNPTTQSVGNSNTMGNQ